MQQPNILLLCADMIGAKHFGCYGNPALITPNVDRLASGGVRFDQAYCAAPPCIPARVCMMTGQYAHTNGKMAHMKMRLDREPTVIPEILSRNGYRTGLVGKTHWWPPADKLGCQDAYITIDNHLSPELGERDAYLGFLKDRGLFEYHADSWEQDKDRLQPDALPPECLKVNWTGDTACRLLESYAKRRSQTGQPFLLFCSFVEPHGSGSVQSELLQRFRDVPLPPIVGREGEHEAKPETQRLAVERWNRGLSEADRDRTRRGVYASLSLVDANIGKILERLTAFGLRDNTYVIFLTDHGDLLFDHGCIEKTFLYDGAVRIPFIVAGPGIPRGESRSHLVSQIDLLPTVLELCGLAEDPRWNIEGRSVRPVIRNPSVCWRSALFCEVEQTVHLNSGAEDEHLVSSSQAKMLRTGPWKYIYTLVGGHIVEEELYHLEHDPDELFNLAATAEHEHRLADFRAEILRWMVATEINRLHPDPISHYAEPSIARRHF